MTNPQKLKLFLEAADLKLSVENQLHASICNLDSKQADRLEKALNSACRRYERRKMWLPLAFRPTRIVTISSDQHGIFSQESKRFEKVISTGAKVRSEVKKRARRKSSVATS